MNFSQSISKILMIIVSLSLIGCTSSLKQVQSGFLKDYSQLKKSTEFENASVYRADGFNLQTMQSVKEIHIVPFEIWINEDNLIGVDSEQLRKLHHYFHDNLKQALEQKYRIVDKASIDS